MADDTEEQTPAPTEEQAVPRDQPTRPSWLAPALVAALALGTGAVGYAIGHPDSNNGSFDPVADVQRAPDGNGGGVPVPDHPGFQGPGPGMRGPGAFHGPGGPGGPEGPGGPDGRRCPPGARGDHERGDEQGRPDRDGEDGQDDQDGDGTGRDEQESETAFTSLP